MTDLQPDIGEPIDFSEVEGLQPFDPQRIAFEIIYAQYGISNAGFEKVDVRLQVIEPEEIKGRLVFDAFSFHPKALPFTKEKLVALGLGDFKGTAEELAEELFGLDGVAAIGIREGQDIPEQPGEKYPDQNQVRRYYPPGTPLSTDRVASLD
jgi:hypothetical protein